MNIINKLESQNNGDIFFDNNEESYAQSLFTNDVPEFKKVLGIIWDGTGDKLMFDVKSIAEEALNLPVTKRNLLSAGAKFYDPLGLISPIVRLLLRKLFFRKFVSINLIGTMIYLKI